MELCNFSADLVGDGSTVDVSIRGGVTLCSPEFVEFSSVFLGVEERGTTGTPEVEGRDAVDVLGRVVRASVLQACFVRGSGHSEFGEKTAVRFNILK